MCMCFICMHSCTQHTCSTHGGQRRAVGIEPGSSATATSALKHWAVFSSASLFLLVRLLFWILRRQVGLCVSWLSLALTTYLRQSAYKEERFILPHGFRLSPSTHGLLLWACDNDHAMNCSSWETRSKGKKDQGSSTPVSESSSKPHLLTGLPSPSSAIGWGPNLPHTAFEGRLRSKQCGMC